MNIIIQLYVYIKNSLYNLVFLHYRWNNLFKYNIIYMYYIILLLWITEWLIIFDYFFNELTRQNIFFFNGITFLLLILLIYWFLVWGLTIWRRTYYGKFTRGERLLWAKAYAAFWIAEIVTIISFILIYFWLSWGPEIFVTRVFYMPRRGLLLEIVCYTYLITLLYFMKFSIYWNTWKTQFNLSLFIIIILGYLIWHNICFLLTRETINNSYGTHWNSIKLNVLVYSVSHEWWVTHSLGWRLPYFKYGELAMYLKSNEHPFTKFWEVTEYESNLFLNNINNFINFENSLFYIYNTDLLYYFNLFSHYSLFYSRRSGFIPKRLTFWEFLTYLKIWHQLVILLWFLLYFCKLKNTLTGSYQFIAVCSFNIYCCYLISFFLILVNYFTLFELFIHIKCDIWFLNRLFIFFTQWLNYIFSNLLKWSYSNNLIHNIFYVIG